MRAHCRSSFWRGVRARRAGQDLTTRVAPLRSRRAPQVIWIERFARDVAARRRCVGVPRTDDGRSTRPRARGDRQPAITQESVAGRLHDALRLAPAREKRRPADHRAGRSVPRHAPPRRGMPNRPWATAIAQGVPAVRCSRHEAVEQVLASQPERAPSARDAPDRLPLLPTAISRLNARGVSPFEPIPSWRRMRLGRQSEFHCFSCPLHIIRWSGLRSSAH
jgi:hypothetical protein